MSVQAATIPPLEPPRPGRSSPAPRSSTLWTGAAILSCWLAAAGLFCAGPARIGFLSDDFNLIARAGVVPWLHPIEPHHYSPVMAALFKLTAQGVIGSGTWHLAALLVHGANILLLWLILVRGLAVARPYAWVITMLFALGAPGFEAIAWASSLGYVLVEATVLAAVWLSLSAPPPRGETLVRWGTPLVQLAALAIWDWGIMLLPIVAACCCFRAYRPLPTEPRTLAQSASEGALRHGLTWFLPRLRFGLVSCCEQLPAALRRSVSLLWPTAVAWIGVLLVKFSCGYSAGYQRSFDPIRQGYYFLTSPIRCLYPNGLAAFYWSAAGLGLALVLMVFLAVRCRSDARIALLVGIFLLCQLPYVFFAAPTSRYYYFSSPFFFAAAVLAVAPWKSRAGKVGLLAAVLGLHACWAWQRADLYQGAYRQSQAVWRTIEAAAPGDARTPLVVVDLPDSYGPPGLMWSPNMWRNGVSAFHRELIRVNTPGCPFAWPPSGIPELSRAEILARYRHSDVCAVSYAAEGDWRSFQVERWNAAASRCGRRTDRPATGGDPIGR